MNHQNLSVSFLSSRLRTIYQSSHNRWLARVAGALGAFTPVLVLANPTGGQVVAGSATIGSAGSNGVIVDQNSQRAAINWQQFSIGSNEYVQFVQPNSSSVVFDRVTGNNPSSIFGSIRANGQVFLINPNGILFAPGSTLDVSSLSASTLDISDPHFMAGRYVFSRNSGTPGTVVNQGNITVTRGGYVVLSGDYVENDGIIQAQTGRVVLASGRHASLTLDNKGGLISYEIDAPTLARLAGVDNAGSITAQGGMVVMTADVANALTATAVNNSGLITAQSVRRQGGEIVLLAQGGDIENSGTLDASAAQAGAAGGTIIVHGNGKTELTSASEITTAGHYAKGGFIDLSGHDLAIRGRVTAGHGGSLLLDPTTLNIVAGGATGVLTTSVNSIGTSFIAGKLNAGSNVTLVAIGTIQNMGAGHVITATAGANAGNSRFQIATGTLTSCGGAFGVCVGVSSFPAITHNAGTIDLTGLTVNIKGTFVADASQGAVTLDTISAKSGIFVTGGTVQVNGNLTSSIGILSLAANRGTATGAFIKTASGVKLRGSAVQLNVGGSYGGVISVGTVNATSSDNITLNYNSLQSPTSPEKIVTGSLTGKRINVSAKGPKASIDINGSISAVNPTGVAGVNITATGNGGAAHVTVNGNITVSGKQTSNSGNTLPFDLPLTAALRIEALGAGSGAHTAKVNGDVSVTAHGGSYSRTSTCECGTSASPAPRRLQTGKGGVAAAYIIATGSSGSAMVNGSLSAKGPDAHVGVFADKVTVNGNISVTGSGHQVKRTVGSQGVSYNSSNSAGQATLQLGAGQVYAGSPAAPTVVLSNTIKVAGNITVAGKGIAEVALLGSNVSAGNITVTATAAKGKLRQKGVTTGACTRFAADDCTDLDSMGFWRGINNVLLLNGSIDAGRADIFVGGGTAINGGSNGSPALNVKLGSLSVTGVGQADIGINGKKVQTQNLSATATRGTEKGSGSSQSAGTSVIKNIFQHTFNLNGGEADIKIRSGNSGSNSSGQLLTQNGGPVTINGSVIAKGPSANVDIRGQSIKITGNATLAGSGGSLTSDTVFTPAAGTGYHVHYVGPGENIDGLNIEGGASGAVSIGGNVSVKGPGMVGVIVIGHTVKMGGFSASASAAETYSILDTRRSPTTTTFTGGSLAVIIDDVAGTKANPAFTSASVNGNVSLSAKDNVDMPSRIKIGGTLVVTAGGDINGSAGTILSRFNAIGSTQPHVGGSHNNGPSSSAANFLPTLSAQAKTVSMIAGGSIDLTGATVTTPGVMALKAGADIILSGVTLNTGTLAADAGSTIHNGGASGTITTKALALVAGKNINLSSTQINVGSGVLAPAASNAALTAMFTDPVFAALVTGDPTLLGGLAAAGLSPTASAPDAVFQAGNALTLGNLNLTGTYLYMQAGSISLLGKVTAPKGAVVQLAPNGVAGTVDAEGTGAAGANLNLNDSGLFNVFPDGITLVLGGAGQGGAVTLGNNGSFNIGSDNLIVDTSGTVTGLGNVISTGQVVSLSSLLNGLPPVTAGEIDPTSNTTSPGGDKKQGPGANMGDVGTGGQPTIGQDTNSSSVCH